MTRFSTFAPLVILFTRLAAFTNAQNEVSDASESDVEPSVAVAHGDVSVLFLQLAEIETAQERLTKLEILDLPLARAFVYAEEDGEIQTREAEMPLVRVLSLNRDEPGHRRVALLELPASALVRWEIGEENLSWDLVEVLGESALSHSRTPEGWRWSLIDGWLATGLSAERAANHGEFQLLNLPLISLVDHVRDGEARDFTILKIPFFRPLYGRHVRENSVSREFLFLFHSESRTDEVVTEE